MKEMVRISVPFYPLHPCYQNLLIRRRRRYQHNSANASRTHLFHRYPSKPK